MSLITDVSIACDDSEDLALGELQAWMVIETEDKEHYPLLGGVGVQWPGNKVSSQTVLFGCYNYFKHELFLARVQSIAWLRPCSVVVTMWSLDVEGWEGEAHVWVFKSRNGDNLDPYDVIPLADRKLVQVTP